MLNNIFVIIISGCNAHNAVSRFAILKILFAIIYLFGFFCGLKNLRVVCD